MLPHSIPKAISTILLIEEDAARTLNPNIRKFFTALGWADEIGSGIRNTQKYLHRYIKKAAPVFIDEPLFRTIIPLAHYTLSDYTDKWFDWLELDGKWRTKLT